MCGDSLDELKKRYPDAREQSDNVTGLNYYVDLESNFHHAGIKVGRFGIGMVVLFSKDASFDELVSRLEAELGEAPERSSNKYITKAFWDWMIMGGRDRWQFISVSKIGTHNIQFSVSCKPGFKPGR